MSERLDIRTLGSLSVLRGGQSIPFETRKEAALLVYLACTQHPYPREVLAEFLWEDRTQGQSLANLRHVLAQLRQKVGDYVVISDAVALNPDSGWWLDATEFETQLDRAGVQPQALENALDLYQGDFLAGFSVDSTAFEQWVTHERERLRLRAMQALDMLVVCYQMQGNYAAGIARATQLMQMDNLREETHRHLMLLLAQSGQRGKALDQYETCRRLLADELGVAPTPETTGLYERIKGGEPLEEKPRELAVRGYELRGQIGAGSFGTVLRGWQPVVDREVAIKVIRSEYANHPDFIRRFEIEAQVAARLEHPFIVPLYDYWREPDGAFLVMRYLRGGCLSDRLTRGPLTLAEAVRLVEQIAAALAVAHRQGVIHRDIKPANILLDEDGNAYLTDFGVAKVLGAAVLATQDGALIGSPAYLSPEQITGEPVTPASDLYSFGLVLFQALTGQTPFPSSLSPASLLYKQVHEPLPEIQSLRPDLPAALDGVIQTATAKDPTRRYPDALGLAEAFRHAAGQSRPTVPDLPSPVETRPYRAEDMTWIVAPRNPYKGLHAFEEADAADFFGREVLVELLLARLGEADHLAHFLAVIGPSGCGKSSVVNAGLLPALREGRLPGSENWFVAGMTPREFPLSELAAALASVATRSTSRLLEQLHADPRGLLWAAESVVSADAGLLLVVDQFEELFALTRDDTERDQFLALLHTAVTAPDSRVRVILTLRADFTDRPLEYPAFGALLRRRTEFVLPLTAEELERVVSLPAEQVGLALEPGLAAAMVADVTGQPGALPLLQYALTELYHRRDNHVFTLAAYHALGGTRGALARRADELHHELTPSDQEAARQMFLRLVTLGDDVEDTRRRIRQAELLSLDGAVMQRVMNVFGRARLLTFDHDPETRAPTVEVAHEALIREWGQLRAWLDERGDVRQERLLAAAATEWEQAGRERSYLLHGSRLAQFEDWAARTDVALTPDERVFLETSTVEQQAQQTRRQRIRNIAFGITAGVAVIMAVLALVALNQKGQAEDARATSDANALIAQRERDNARELALVNGARAALNKGDPDTALALAVAANRDEHPSAQAQLILSEAAYTPGTTRIFNQRSPYAIAVSPDGRSVLSGPLDYGGGDVSLYLWDITTGQTIRTFSGHTEVVWDVAFSPDGRLALSTGMYQKTFLWDVITGEKIRDFEWPEGECEQIFRLAFSPDGQKAYGSYGCAPVEWDVATGKVTRIFPAIEDLKWVGLDISPDGRLLLTTSWVGKWVLWDIASGQPLHKFGWEGEAHSDWTNGCFSADGRYVLTSSQALIQWDLESYQEIRRFEVGGNSLFHIACSPSGRLVAAGDSGSLHLWDLETGEEIPLLKNDIIDMAHAQVAFGKDDRTILFVTIGSDQIRVWDLQYGAEIGHFEPEINLDHTRYWIDWAGLSPDYRFAVFSSMYSSGDISYGTPGPFVLVDMSTGQEILRLAPPLEQIGALGHAQFTRDGRAILGYFDTGQIILWDAFTGERLRTFLGHRTGVTSTVLSPDGRTFLSTDFENSLLIWWNLATGDVLRRSVLPDRCGVILFTPDSRYALLGTELGAVLLWDVAAGQEVRRFEGHNDSVISMNISPDGRTFLSGDAAGLVIQWDITTGQKIRQFTGPADTVCLMFSRDGQTFFFQTSESILQWDIATGDVIRSYPASFFGWSWPSPDGESIYFAKAGGLYGNRVTLYQWRLDSTNELMDWTLSHRYVRELTCAERDLYQLEPRCNAEGLFPTSTPYITPTTVQPTPLPPRSTAPSTTITLPRATTRPVLAARTGEQHGEVTVGESQLWRYAGRAGETLTVRVYADSPCNQDPNGEAAAAGTCLNTWVTISDPDGAILTIAYATNMLYMSDDIEPGVNTDSLVDGLVLPLDGDYRIEVSGSGYQTGGGYTLSIELLPPEVAIPTPEVPSGS